MRVITTTADRAEFAAERKAALRRGENTLKRSVRLALGKFGRDGWYDALVRRAESMARAAYREETGKTTSQEFRAAMEDFSASLRDAMDKTKEPDLSDRRATEVQINAIAASLSTAAHNVAMEAAAETLRTEREVGKVWLTMDDEFVRVAHREVDNVKVPLDEKFTVAGVQMERPGDMSAPVELWINCRCVLGIEYLTIEQAVTAAVGEEHTMDEFTDDPPGLSEDDRINPGEEVAWYGVLAPEGVVSGDGRKFAAGALRSRDLPLPLSWQEVNDQGHDGSVVVGRIDEVWRSEGQMRGRGVFLASESADKAIGLLAEGGIRGVSIDADDGTMEMEMRDGSPLGDGQASLDDLITVFTDARICGATLCPIPAFQEAFVSLGAAPADFLPEGSDAPAGEDLAAALVFRSISEKPWDGSSSRFTDEQWYRSTILHLNGNSKVKSDNKFPILEPDGALSRAGVHAAAARLNQTNAPAEAVSKAKASLRTAYRELGEDAPDVLKAAAFAPGGIVKTEDGPGWLTHPVDTDRLRDYWVHGKGAAKIGWGTPGDFNRCRAQLAKYVKAQYLAGYCANRHYDALGFWPGRPTSAETLVADAGQGVALRLVDVEHGERPPMEWFTDPHLTGPSPVVVTAERRLFGHLAQWGTCHIGINGVCTTAPPSLTDYAYFRTGAVLTDSGEVPVGHLTMDTGHAEQRCGARAAAGHYDNTGFCVADVACGEDEHGIWVAGMVRPGVSEEQVYALRSATLSGDWREVGGNLELVAALAVNVPGFPVPRTSLAASGGRQVSLVAAGVVPVSHRVTDDISAIVHAAIDEYEDRAKRKVAMADLQQAVVRSRMAALAGRR